MLQLSSRPAESVQQACEAVGLVGSELRRHLAREVPAKVLLRRGRDVVLLTGPTGSGKEKVAAAVHEASRQTLTRTGELVEVNCANLGRGLFESELFGYKRGAFTGAERDHEGLLSRAQGGTLVLDEIQALSADDQSRLLRLLGEREYRAVGDSNVRTTNALILLASNRDLRQLVERGEFRRDLFDRALAKIRVPSLYERRQDIGELAQAFALEAAAELGATDCHGFTRRARADIESAIVRTREVSVRRLRELVRNIFFLAAADRLPDAIESDLVLPVLEEELSYTEAAREDQDVLEVEQELDLAVARVRVRELAASHNVSARTVERLCTAVRGLMDDMDDQPRSYRNVVERTNRLAKVALWLVSGAATQAEFRKFFGTLDADMPTKSVAHQIYHEVFHEGGDR